MGKLCHIILLPAAFLLSVAASAQESALDILKAPSSPAANLLGISPSDVQRPTDPSAFMVSLQNATNNYSVLPASYAVDIAPAWLFWGDDITYENFVDSTSIGEALRQSFLLSTGFTSKDDSSGRDASLGLGFKVSILRGAVRPQALRAVERARTTLSELNTIQNRAVLAFRNSDAYRNAPDNETRQRMIDSVTLATRESVQSIAERLVKEIEAVDFSRYRWKLDLAGGMSLFYPNQTVTQGSINRAGIWITGGYETAGGFSALGLVRYLYNPDKAFADDMGVLKQDDLNTLDAGARFLYDNGNKFTFSAEGVYRSVLNKTEVNPTWRFTLNADYEIGPNRLLTLALGRDYDGTFNKDGNLIAALNLLLGFGNNRRQLDIPR